MADIYPILCDRKGYNTAFKECIETTIQKLLSVETSVKKPGMLLGKIQGGKTNTYIGILGLAFDKGFDLAIVLTKGTKALTQQTYQRLDKEFEDFIEEDEVKLFDIMNIPEELTSYIREQKLVLIAKKETHNLDRIIDLFKKYPDLAKKRVLIIDDEADYASVGFKKDKNSEGEVSVNTLATKVDRLRKLGSRTSFLQVTATPYSLYLQPETFEVKGEEYHPIRPAFTELVPIHDEYIGSTFYFEKSENPDSPAYYLHKDVPEKELQVLGKPDQRYLSNILTSPNLSTFRSAIINFLVSGVIRRLQEKPRKHKSSFLIHTEISKAKHAWQTALVNALLDALTTCLHEDNSLFEGLVKNSYEEFKLSIPDGDLPSFQEVKTLTGDALSKGFIGVCKINSEVQVAALLDKKGQLRLDNPFNIFIGGQILDRGITIDNLTGFFYGRNPNRFQQDTVLQHSRMYGARSIKDLCVTRFYTSARIFDAMKRIHEFDVGLREAFKKGQHENGVIFLHKDPSGKITTCSPNKILISSTDTIRPYRRFLPRGMQTVSQTKMNRIDKAIDRVLIKYNFIEGSPILIKWGDAAEILQLIKQSYEFKPQLSNINYEWDDSICVAIIQRLCKGHSNPDKDGKIHCIVKRNRNSSRLKANNTYNDAPDDGKVDRPLAKDTAIDLPLLQLFHQNGRMDNGWRDVSLWWPVLVCPKLTKTSVFAADTL